MHGNLEFRVLLFYLGIVYLLPLIRWRRIRRSPALVGARGEHQERARWVAAAFFAVPAVNFVLDGPWPWYAELGVGDPLRWCAVVPATLAVLLLTWACFDAEYEAASGNQSFVQDGPYHWLRHPQLLASSVFFLALAILASNGVVLISTIVGILMLRLVVAPAVEEDLEEEFGAAYEQYRERTGCFFFRLRRVPKAQYTVPRRFGLSSVLALTTAFAILFGILNFWKAPPVVYLFVATQIAAVCIVQILFGSAARIGSAFTGAVLLPFWTAMSLDPHQLNQLSLVEIAFWFVLITLFGALLGYCTGGLAAGFFLVTDLLEPYLPGAKRNAQGELNAGPEGKAH